MTYPEPHEWPWEWAHDLAAPDGPHPDPDGEPSPHGPWDDSTELDPHAALSVAMVEAVFGDDVEGLAALIRYTGAPVLTAVCLTLAKLISEGLDPELITSGAFRSWAAEAVRRK